MESLQDSFKTHLLNAAIKATALCALFVTAITIIAEYQAPLKEWLKVTFTHHWIGKSVLAVVVWAVATILITLGTRLLREQKTDQSLINALYMASVICVVSAFSMTIFFILHYLQIV